MSLKQLIKRKKLFNSAVDAELELPGEPLIYSIKAPLSNRTRSTQFFRNMKWRSLLKSFFQSCYNTSTPVVIIVRFYVTPPAKSRVSAENLRKERVPAVYSYELCDYVLSFLEMLHHVLINSYRQVIKMDIEKWYSDRPRTTMKFMTWDQYVKLQNHNPVHTETQGISKARKARGIQSKLQGNEQDDSIRAQESDEQSATPDGTLASDCALSNPCTVSASPKKTPTATLPASHKKT